MLLAGLFGYSIILHTSRFSSLNSSGCKFDLPPFCFKIMVVDAILATLYSFLVLVRLKLYLFACTIRKWHKLWSDTFVCIRAGYIVTYTLRSVPHIIGGSLIWWHVLDISIQM